MPTKAPTEKSRSARRYWPPTPRPTAPAGRIGYTLTFPDPEYKRSHRVPHCPALRIAVIIDGYTQSGTSANTLALGDNAVLLIELNGVGAAGANGLTLAAGSSGSTVRGLVINALAKTESTSYPITILSQAISSAPMPPVPPHWAIIAAFTLPVREIPSAAHRPQLAT